MEYVSLGGLVPGLELKSIFLGVSQSRNPNLAAVFYRMKLIESYGTGIGKIQRMYDGFARHPEFETAQGVFRVTLPNCNEISETTVVQDSKQAKAPETEPMLEKQKNMIVEYATENGQVTRKEVEELLEAGTTKAFRLLRELCDEGRLKAEGNGKLSKYLPHTES
jgi:ATP-dependent DNA helicase RecG